MARIALVSPPFLPGYMRNARCDFVSLSKTQWFPIWLGYAGAFLEKLGHHVTLIDAPAYGLDRDQTKKLIRELRPDLLVVYTGRLSEDSDVVFADAMAGALDIPGVFVGPYASTDPTRTLSKATRVDALIKGEFELPLAELADGRAYETILNLVHTRDGSIETNPVRPLLGTDQLDAIPFVTDFFRRHLDFRYYKAPSELHPFLDIMSGRGCAWGRCTYCLWVHSFICGSVYNARSVQSVVEELRFVQGHIPAVQSIMIQDDTLTEQRASDLSEGFLQAGVTVPWSCYVRAELGQETLKLMKRANCRNLHVGYESASPLILKTIKKGITKERMTRFTVDAKKVGLNIHGDFAIGFPGETAETIKETIDWACEMRPHTAQFQLMIPFPGTPYFEQLHAGGLMKDGIPNYPGLSAEDMEAWSKRAYRRFYISLPFLKQVLCNPHEMLFSRLETYWRALPAVFWKRYVR